jgi:ferric-dicitrate binding protein FerR (iron transport regulator)
MHASTLRDAADTLTETVSELAHTVAEKTPEVTNKVSDTALRLASLTPWVEQPSTSWLRRRRWMLAIAALAAFCVLGWWLKNQRTSRTDFEAPAETAAPNQPDRRLKAAAGN